MGWETTFWPNPWTQPTWIQPNSVLIWNLETLGLICTLRSDVQWLNHVRSFVRVKPKIFKPNYLAETPISHKLVSISLIHAPLLPYTIYHVLAIKTIG